MAGQGFMARLLRLFRWQEQNQRQVRLLAAGYGLCTGLAYAAVTWNFKGLDRGAVGGLSFGGAGAIVYGLGRRHRLRRRERTWQ